MQSDQRGLDISAASPDAAIAFDAAVDGLLGMHPDAGQRLKAVLAADPEMPMAHVLKCYFFMLMATAPLKQRAQMSAAQAKALGGDATRRERLHIDAALHWSHGRKRTAIACWEAALSEQPTDILAMRMAHHGHFYQGDARNLRDTVARCRYAWDGSLPGYGFVLGMLAFGHEENHDYGRALDAGRAAVEINPGDAWAIHAVAHVHEMRGEADAGIGWIESNLSGWQGINNFRYHIQWHRLLMYLERGEYDQVLALYDEALWDPDSDEYLDLVNDVSLLMRLEMHGCDVGGRWQALAEKCRAHSRDQVLAFIDVHYAVALSAANDAGLGALMDGMREVAHTSGEDNGYITAEVGLPLANAICAHRSGDFDGAVETLLPLRYELYRLGGSHAQRDLFSMLLLDAALASGRTRLAKMLVSERLASKPGNAWARAKAEALGIAA